MTSSTTIVVPTIGRASLHHLLAALAHQDQPVTAPVVVVDDRPSGPPLDPAELDPTGTLDVRVARSGGGGPARARNLGWRRARTPWVSFLDDDVVVPPDWFGRLLVDLERAEAGALVGSQARIVVPRPEGRRPTDDERSTLGLADAAWITADMSFRRDALAEVGGFDERFGRAFREDTDIALRLGADRGTIGYGARQTVHPVRQDGFWASVKRQRGNADDQLMRRLHGRDWWQRGRSPKGRFGRHVAVTALGLAAGVATATGHRRIAALTGLGWLAGTAEFTAVRVLPGPRDATELARMTLTSAVIPPVAVWHAVRGRVQHRHQTPWKGAPDAVLFDRDGTLVHDVPYNGDPARVRPMEQAREVLDRLRDEGVRVAVVTNQSGIARGMLEPAQVESVNRRVEELLGPLEGFYVCPHGPQDDCECRKPAPGMVLKACADLGVDPSRVVVVGDIGSDVRAAQAAGAAAVLVPTPVTLGDEVLEAPIVADDLRQAADLILGGQW
ncbi:HAD-IIIA family hydrolase [Nocardioides sp. SYSU DS0651]|uniref:HAD-IIIA family hydrolase n=1 Tax=Nocardioides sp. SYSU DS0651 TaxID=3415955 RepID=UPI003F4C84AD